VVIARSTSVPPAGSVIARAGQFLAHDRLVQQVAALPAVLLGDADPVEAGLGDPAGQVLGELLRRLEPACHVLRALPLGEVADRLPQLLLLLGELEAESRHRLPPIGLMTSSPNRASAVSVAS